MARNGTESLAETAVDVKPQPVRVDLDPEVHYRLRIVAARHRMSMAKFAREELTRIVLEQTEKDR